MVVSKNLDFSWYVFINNTYVLFYAQVENGAWGYNSGEWRNRKK